MDQLPKVDRGKVVLQHRATSLDLILQARAMRHQWVVAACARLSAKLAWLVTEFIARTRPNRTRQPAASERLRLSGRPA